MVQLNEKLFGLLNVIQTPAGMDDSFLNAISKLFFHRDLNLELRLRLVNPIIDQFLDRVAFLFEVVEKVEWQNTFNAFILVSWYFALELHHSFEIHLQLDQDFSKCIRFH